MDFFFTSPLFLWGLAGSLIPLLVHLERRRSARTVPFTMIRFLREVERRRFLNLRILEILLLLLRMAVLALIALALAGPTLTFPGGAPGWLLHFISRSEHRDTVILLDTSASMAAVGPGGRPWDEARRVLLATARRPRILPALAVYPFSDGLDRPAPTLPPVPLPPDLARGLEQLRPAGQGTDVPKALVQLRHQIGSLEGREVVVVTDLQRNAWEELLRGTALLPPALRLTVVDASERDLPNLWLQGLERPPLPWGFGQEEVLRFLVRNCGLAPEESVSADVLLLESEGGLVQKQPVTVSPGVNLLLEWGVRVQNESRFRGRIRLEPGEGVWDALPEDNRLDVDIPVLAGRRVLIVGAEETLTRAALSLAFSPPVDTDTGRTFLRVSHVPSVSELPSDLSQFAFVVLVVAPGKPLSTDALIPLDGFVGDGGGLLLVPARLAAVAAATEEAEADPVRAGLGHFGIGVRGVRVPEKPLSIETADETHPIFASLADLPRTALRSIHISRLLSLEGDVSVLASASYSAAGHTEEASILVERPLGSGTVLCLAAGLEAESSDIAVSSLMVPLFDALAKYLSARSREPAAPPAPSRLESDLSRLSADDTAALARRADVRFLNASALGDGIPSRALGGSLTGLLLGLALVCALLELWLSNASL